MKRLAGLLICILWIGFGAVGADAEVFSWVDADGVRHFSNTPPPDTTPGVTSAPEQAFDAAADQQRSAIDRGTMNKIYQDRMAASEKEKEMAAEPKADAKKEKGDTAESSSDEEETPRKKTFAQKQRARAAAHNGPD